jgi:hypothetical protein
VALAAAGAWHIVTGRPRRPGAGSALALIAVVAAGVSLVQSVFYVEIRHRWGVEPLLLTVAAVGVARVWMLHRGAAPALAEARR